MSLEIPLGPTNTHHLLRSTGARQGLHPLCPGSLTTLTLADPAYGTRDSPMPSWDFPMNREHPIRVIVYHPPRMGVWHGSPIFRGAKRDVQY